MEYIKHEIWFDVSIDCVELYKFIENNSDKDYNTICNIANESYLFEEYGRVDFLRYIEEKDVYKPNENRLFFQRMVNAFFKTYDIDKSELITILYS